MRHIIQFEGTVYTIYQGGPKKYGSTTMFGINDRKLLSLTPNDRKLPSLTRRTYWNGHGEGDIIEVIMGDDTLKYNPELIKNGVILYVGKMGSRKLVSVDRVMGKIDVTECSTV